MTRERWLLAMLAVAACVLGGCAFPVVVVSIAPDDLLLVQGDSGTVTLDSALTCDATPPRTCPDISAGLTYEVFTPLPPGTTSRFDSSLQSGSTPGVVRLTVDVGLESPPGVYPLTVHAVVGGVRLSNAVLTLRVLPAGGTAATAAPAAAAGGPTQSLAALADGTLWVWGALSAADAGVTIARQQALRGIAAVAAGAEHLLALHADGTVWAWGANSEGQLGDGTRIDRTQPGRVSGLTDVQAIAAGSGNHSLALRRDGTVWAWGSNASGQLGDGTETDRTLPVQVSGLRDVRAIAASVDISLALTADGIVWTWGRAITGEEMSPFSGVPAPVVGLRDVQAVALGGAHALAVRRDGTVWAWGDNGHGQLGDGTVIDRMTPVRVLGLDGVGAVAAGGQHSLALRVDGTVWTWGASGHGQRGDGSIVDREVPGQVPRLEGVRAIAAGEGHNLAVLDCGQLWVWGRNLSGQLGDGGMGYVRPAPLTVLGLGDPGACNRVALLVAPAGDGAGEVHIDGSFSGCSSPCFDVVDRGSTVTLDAVPGPSSVFDRWASDCQGSSPQLVLTMDATTQCTAVFRSVAPDPFLLSVSARDGRVTSSAGGILGPPQVDCGPVCSAIFPGGTLVTLAATADPGFVFAGWSGDCTGTADQISVLMDRRRACTAHFVPPALTVAVTGEGSVTSDPAGIDCPAACRFEPRTSVVMLTAVAADGWRFAGWGGDCAGTASQTTVGMDADRTCTAAFSRIPGLFFLTMIMEGTGSVTSAPAGIACPGDCIAPFAPGTAVDLTAIETPQSLVLGWFDDCAAPGVIVNRIVMDADKTCRLRFSDRPPVPVAIVTFAPGPYAVGDVVVFDGSASHVLDPVTGTQDPAGIRAFDWDFENDGLIEVSGPRGAAAVVQHAFQAPGTYTVRLRVRGGPFDESADRLHDVTIVSASGALRALTALKAGDGDGTIATDPPGLIGCGAGCASAGPVQVEDGRLVTLTAEAAPGSTFAGWSGTGCTSASASVAVSMVADRACTATFQRGSVVLTVAVTKPAGSIGRIIGVSPSGNPISCDGVGPVCSASFPPGTTVTVRPSDTSIELGLFGSWAGCDAVGGLAACSVTLTGNRTVTATFVQ